MKIEKRGSGYRVRKTYNGKTYAHTFDHKPTQKEAIKALSEKMDRDIDDGTLNFEKAATQYIEVKSNELSPGTVRTYIGTLKNISPKFKKIKIQDITQLDVQTEINRISKDRSPKTVRNYNGFIVAVIQMYRPGMVVKTTLPQKVKKEPYIPTDKEVQAILEEVKDTAFYIPFCLACYGLRRSEICALTVFDIKDDIVSINKALVLDKDKNWVLKTTKTTESTRQVVIPHTLAAQIKKQGYVYKGYPGSLNDKLFKVQKKLGINRFSLHKFRHYFASTLSDMNVPEAEILRAGGWKTDEVMKTVYRHSKRNNLESQRETAQKLAQAIGQ